MHLAGAGSGVYNATRQVGSVLGSASMAAFMTSRISAEMPGGGQRPAAEGSVTKLPPFLHEPFSAALSQSLLLPAFVALFGVVAALFLRGFGDGLRPAQVEFDDGPDERHAFTAARVAAPMNAEHDHFPDDDEYVEYLIDWDEPYPPIRAVRQQAAAPEVFAGDESDTEVLRVHVEHPLHAPAETWHGGPVETWHSLLDDEVSDDPVEFELPPAPYAAPIAVPYVVADLVATADVDANGDRPWRSILDDLLADMPAPHDIGSRTDRFPPQRVSRRTRAAPPSAAAGGRAQQRTARPRRRRRRRGNLRQALDAVPRLAEQHRGIEVAGRIEGVLHGAHGGDVGVRT